MVILVTATSAVLNNDIACDPIAKTCPFDAAHLRDVRTAVAIGPTFNAGDALVYSGAAAATTIVVIIACTVIIIAIIITAAIVAAIVAA